MEKKLRTLITQLVNEEISLMEKKRKKDEAPSDENVELDLNMPTEEPAAEPAAEPTTEPTDTMTPTDGGMDIDPTVKSIQDSLQKAYASAKQLGDEKLMNQIGNTITMLVRTQVLGGQASE